MRPLGPRVLAFARHKRIVHNDVHLRACEENEHDQQDMGTAEPYSGPATFRKHLAVGGDVSHTKKLRCSDTFGDRACPNAQDRPYQQSRETIQRKATRRGLEDVVRLAKTSLDH